MSIDGQAELELLRIKSQGLRVALAVTVGFCAGLVLGDILPFLAPLFAVQFLLASRRAPTLSQGLITLLVSMLTGALLVGVTGMFGERPWILLPLLWLFYLACFTAQGRQPGGAGPALMLVIAIVVPMLDIAQSELGESIVLVLVKAVGLGLLLTWGAHALLPDPAGEQAKQAAAQPHEQTLVIRQAMASATILLAMVALCLSDPRLATAIVVPITVASLLSQFSLGMSSRTALGLVLVNLLGGMAASVAFTLFELRPTLWLVALILLLVSLLFAGKAAIGNASGKIFGGGLITFVILFGLGVSPLPTETPQLFSSRIAYVLFAVVYAIGLAALLWPRARVSERRPQSV
ncbi:DUF2955 domain-containing protein [Pseudomonas sp. FP198]|uniref:DUF2955 domain-containing protein n=1 Tax=Pseudomonas sp. FP198 TaxID=2954084 RepID=UPI00273590BE|nr:DUF2955 domain-containing protein [Pseudomonas sp. FP198]WLG93815.1 DUF2955 domain-containing protein [Pseudomonas sp. FP198]